jgi:hypothetical protein
MFSFLLGGRAERIKLFQHSWIMLLGHRETRKDFPQNLAYYSSSLQKLESVLKIKGLNQSNRNIQPKVNFNVCKLKQQQPGGRADHDMQSNCIANCMQ